jgi:hypothetical protein
MSVLEQYQAIFSIKARHVNELVKYVSGRLHIQTHTHTHTHTHTRIIKNKKKTVKIVCMDNIIRVSQPCTL